MLFILQGFFVSLFYCFLNSEVRTAIRHRFNTWRDERNIRIGQNRQSRRYKVTLFETNIAYIYRFIYMIFSNQFSADVLKQWFFFSFSPIGVCCRYASGMSQSKDCSPRSRTESIRYDINIFRQSSHIYVFYFVFSTILSFSIEFLLKVILLAINFNKLIEYYFHAIFFFLFLLSFLNVCWIVNIY